jgi:hypothetical protein
MLDDMQTFAVFTLPENYCICGPGPGDRAPLDFSNQ